MQEHVWLHNEGNKYVLENCITACTSTYNNSDIFSSIAPWLAAI